MASSRAAFYKAMRGKRSQDETIVNPAMSF